ncbi:TIGR02588 family protein [Calothrix sp. 336/3]|uniref:TIGR02588 family protein n=1 Tax=Calothrix sp. 336/3 TaxID=1337936 RepID=UPI0004E31725|nr:TIGR02588 family protein [Calothrix sp. 336/3]AKG20518.1 hypothetical protein IJ00_03595 [Calothrix sp. 336/3]
MNHTSADKQKTPKRTLAEWISFSISSLILAVMVGLVIYIWQDKTNQQPPKISAVEEGIIQENSGYYYVPFSVTNHGGSTAESVQIIAELQINGEVESGEQQIDFLSRGEKEQGAFIFKSDPRQGKLTIRVASYKLP